MTPVQLYLRVVMNRLTFPELADIHLAYGAANGNAVEARRLYAEPCTSLVVASTESQVGSPTTIPPILVLHSWIANSTVFHAAFVTAAAA